MEQRRRRGRALPLAIYAVAAANVATLWAARGSYIGGWDTAGSMFAVLALNEGSFADGLRKITAAFLNQRRPVFTGGESFIYGLVPGLLNGLHPWVLWGNLVGLAVFVAVSVWMTRRLRCRAHVYWACVVASPAMVSCSIVAYPWLSSTALAYGLAIVWVLSERQRRRNVLWGIVLDTVVFATITAVAFNGYEAGKTFFVVPAVAALTVRGLPLTRRLAWLTITAAVAWVILHFAPATTAGALHTLPREPGLIVRGLAQLVRFYANGWSIDYPGLVVAALLALPSIGTQRLFWAVLLAAVISLVSLNAFQLDGAFLTPHRFLLLGFIAALVVTVAFSGAPRWTPGLVGAAILVAIGMAYTSYHTLAFARRDLPRTWTTEAQGARVYPLPYHRARLDQHIWPSRLHDAMRFIQIVNETTEPHLIFYGFSIAGEDSVNPQFLQSRMLLSLGYRRFLARVVFVDHNDVMYFRFPIRPLPEVPAIAERLSTPFYVHVHLPEYSEEGVQAMYFNRASVVPVDLGLNEFKSFRVDAFAPPGPIPVRPLTDTMGPPEPTEEGYCLSTIAPLEGQFAYLQHPGLAFAARESFIMAFYANRVARRFVRRAELDVEPGTFTVLRASFDNMTGEPLAARFHVEAADECGILVNGQLVGEWFGWRAPSKLETEVLLPSGPNELELVHHQYWHRGTVRLSSSDAEARPIAWRCDPDFR